MSTANADFLIELGTEELPPRALPRLSAAFSQGILDGLDAAGFATDGARSFATPRRLALLIPGLANKQPDQTIDKLGPAVAAAFDDTGKARPAAEGFARSCGVTIDQLEQRQTDKGERLAYSGTQPGAVLADLLPEIVAASLKALPIPKRMRWGASEEAFVRPVHWLVCMHGDQVLPLQCFGLESGRKTRGHRFHHSGWLELKKPGEYESLLERFGHVVADFARRREMIETSVARLLEGQQATALVTDELLDEVTALVEWPVPLSGSFDEQFLVLPREAIVAVLEGHQRYFPVAGPDDALLPRFVTVANLESKEPNRVVEGNERVIRPRLADALFFWNQDTRRGLEAMAQGLSLVSYQKALGSIADKTQRIVSIASETASKIGENADKVRKAATLCKADLLSDMVGEFPELQGIMGGYYARHAGLGDAVAEGIREHYAPVGAGAAIPATRIGSLCALGDKLDSLAGIFALGKRPTGDKDPFALRRAALGVLRILMETPLDLDLRELLQFAVGLQPVEADTAEVEESLMAFFLERLRALYLDKGVSAECFAAVQANGLSSPVDFDARIEAAQAFATTPAAGALGAAHKRVRNILKNKPAESSLDPEALHLTEEINLHKQLEISAGRVDELSRNQDYAAALNALADFETPVAEFFDKVMVMSDDPAEQKNRLALLGELDRLCRSVADISRLSVE